MLYVIGFVYGLVLGSFLTVVGVRVPAGKSVVNPPSSCDSCGTRLKAKDLVPVFSYLQTKGSCRYCGERYGSFHMWMEIIMGVGTSLVVGMFWGDWVLFGIGMIVVSLVVVQMTAKNVHGNYILVGNREG